MYLWRLQERFYVLMRTWTVSKSTFTLEKIRSEGAGEVAQQVKALSVQVDNLSMIPGMHGLRREPTLKSYSDYTMHCGIYMPAHTHILTHLHTTHKTHIQTHIIIIIIINNNK